MLPRRYWIYRWFVAAYVVNFICFFVVALLIGGDAWNGSRRHDGYFLWGSKWGSEGFGPKTYHEVSRALFLYSWWHVVSVMVTCPLAILLGWRAQRIKQAAQAQWARTRGR